MEQLRKVWNLLDARARTQIAGLAAIMLFASLLEAASVGLFIPLLQAILDANSLPEKPWIGDLYALSGATTPAAFTVWLAVGLLAFFFGKNVFLFGVVLVQNRFILYSQARYASELLHRYYRRPYPFHLHRNSAVLTRNVIEALPSVFVKEVLPALNIGLDILLALATLAVLLLIDPWITITVLVVTAALILGFYVAMRRVVGQWGRRALEQSARMLQWISQGLGAIKEIKVLGRENYFAERFAAEAAVHARLHWLDSSFAQLPRFVSETVVVSMVCLVLFLAFRRGLSGLEIATILGVFGVVAIRLMPCANRIIANLSVMRSASAALDLVYEDYISPDLSLSGTGLSGRPPFQAELRLEGVTYRYSDTPHPSLHDVSMTVKRGEAIGIIGPSGAGKTTLVDLLLGLIEPAGGRILIDGADARNVREAWQRQIGYVPQDIYLCDDTLKSNVAFGVPANQIDEARVMTVLRMAQLEALVEALPAGLDTNMGERGARLSGGQKQRVGIARALYRDPDVLVLDEATSALDTEAALGITDVVSNLAGRKTLIVIAHRLSTVRRCDRLVLLRDGRISAEGSFSDLAAEDPGFKRLVGGLTAADAVLE